MENQEKVTQDISMEKEKRLLTQLGIEVEKTFSSKDEIESLVNMIEDKRFYMKGLALFVPKVEALKKQRKEFYLTFDELSEIYEWRYGRIWEDIISPRMKKDINKKNVELIIKTVFAFKHRNKDKETALMLELLKTIGLSVTRASNLLAVSYPQKYPILNSAIWEELYYERKENITSEDYLQYMKDNVKISTKFDVTLEQVSCALWQKWESKH